MGTRSTSPWLPYRLVLLASFAAWGATCTFGAETTVNWVGHARAEVVAKLGRPASALQRGDTEILIYPNNVRIEIRDGEVVAHRAGQQAMLVKGDGSRYEPSERGRVRLVEPPPEAFEAEEEEAPDVEPEPRREPTPASAATSGQATAPTRAAVSAAATPPSEVEAVASEESEGEVSDEDFEAWAGSTHEALAEADLQMLKMAENYTEHGRLDDEEFVEEEPSSAARAVGAVVLGLIHFGFAMLVLRLAINWVDLPCYMPDVAKVAALYVVIREGVHGLGGLGGHWEWIRLFRGGDVVSFFALCGLLVKFKVATQGLTALKIAVATKVATYIVMAALGVALMFGLQAVL